MKRCPPARLFISTLILVVRSTTLAASARISRSLAQPRAASGSASFVESGTEVSRGIRLLVPYLSDRQSEIRAAVARGFGLQTAQARELIPVLEASSASETAPDARDAMLRSLAKLRALAS